VKCIALQCTPDILFKFNCHMLNVGRIQLLRSVLLARLGSIASGTNSINRRALDVVAPGLQREGGGFMVRRPIKPGNEIGGLFLLLDHLDYTVSPGAGFPGAAHPHRGFGKIRTKFCAEYYM